MLILFPYLKKKQTIFLLQLARGVLLVDVEDPSSGLVIHNLSSLPLKKEYYTPFQNKIVRVKEKVVKIGNFSIRIPKILPGELELVRFDNIEVTINEEVLHGVLIITNYKMYIQKKEDNKYVSLIPLKRISGVEKSGGKRKSYLNNTYIYDIIVYRNDLNPNIIIRVSKGEKEITSALTNTLKNFAFRPNLRSLFCFDNKEYDNVSFKSIDWEYTYNELKSIKNININGWKIYEPENEYKRMKVDFNYWRWTDANINFSVCESYPSRFIVPKEIKDSQLFKISQTRSHGRIPILSWHHENGSVICRCSHPKPSLKFKTLDDDKVLSYIKNSRKNNDRKLVIIDTRSNVNNIVLSDDKEKSKGFQIEFMGLDDYLEIRKSFIALKNSCHNEKKDSYWLSTLESTGWLRNIKSILSATYKIINFVHRENTSCLIHSSDSFDRTTQLTSLAMLCLDPFYRTITGFCLLIEKEWKSTGHMFNTRIGRQEIELNNDHRSPIFLQWIDCVWQLMNQNPLSFEFNKYFLIRIIDETLNCRFGTFITDNEQQSIEYSIESRTTSLWTHIHNEKKIFQYLNLLYTPYNSSYSTKSEKVIYPNTSITSIHIWSDLYFSHLPHIKRDMKMAQKANMERIYKMLELELLINENMCDNDKEDKEDVDDDTGEKRRLRLQPPSLVNLNLEK